MHHGVMYCSPTSNVCVEVTAGTSVLNGADIAVFVTQSFDLNKCKSVHCIRTFLVFFR